VFHLLGYLLSIIENKNERIRTNKIVLHTDQRRDILLASLYRPNHEQQHGTLSTQRTSPNTKEVFFKMLKCGYFVVYPSVCLHATMVLLFTSEKLWHSVEWIWLCGHAWVCVVGCRASHNPPH